MAESGGEVRKILEVWNVYFPPGTLVAVGYEITPTVGVKINRSLYLNYTESGPVGGRVLRYRWYRVQEQEVELFHVQEQKVELFREQDDQKVKVICSVHPTMEATVQCLDCVKAKLPEAKTYFCSSSCFMESWCHHRDLHVLASNVVDQNGAEGSTAALGINGQSSVSSYVSPNATYVAENSGGQLVQEVGRSRSYTPSFDDIGYCLKFECVAVDVESNTPQGPIQSCPTSPVALVLPWSWPYQLPLAYM